MGRDQEILPSNTLRNGAYWGMGLILLLIGIIFNPWILEIILKVAIGINVTIHPLNKLYIILFDIYIGTIGVAFLLHDGLVKKFLEKIILVFSSILFALVFIEAYLHYKARPEPEIGVPSVAFHHNYAPESIGFKYPNLKGEHEVITIRTNKLAMRGNMPLISKGKDELRIIILGDSFVQAAQIKYEQTLGPILEKIHFCPAKPELRLTV